MSIASDNGGFVEMNDLSSLQTFVMKFVFPTIWISGFGVGTFSQWFGTASAQNGETRWFLL